MIPFCSVWGTILLETCGQFADSHAPLQVRPGNLAEVKEYALPSPDPPPPGPDINRDDRNETDDTDPKTEATD